MKIIYTTLLLGVLLSACDISALFKKNTPNNNENIQSSEANITGFSFELQDNPYIPHKYTATISNNVITIQIPTYYLTKYGDTLKPSISGTYEQISPPNKTARRFNSERSSMQYSIASKSGSLKIYRVNVIPILNTEALITSFKFEASKNSSLSSDVVGYIAQESKKILIPTNNEISRNNLSYIATISISKNASISPDIDTAYDYSNPISFTITSEDQKIIRVYSVELLADIASIIDIKNIKLGEMKRTEFDEEINLRAKNYLARSNENNSKYTFHIPPAEYLFFQNKFFKFDWDFSFPTKFTDEQFVQFPHIFEVIAKNGVTKRFVEIDVLPLPEPVKISFNHNGNTVYFSYDLINNTVPFPTITPDSVQPSYLDIYYLNEGITAIETEVRYFSNVSDNNVEGIYRKVRLDNTLGGVQVENAIGTIISKNNDTIYSLTINGIGTNSQYISNELFNHLTVNNIIAKLHISGTTSYPQIEATIDDYYDIKYSDIPAKQYDSGRRVDQDRYNSGTCTLAGSTRVYNPIKYSTSTYFAKVERTIVNTPSILGLNYNKQYYSDLPVKYQESSLFNVSVDGHTSLKGDLISKGATPTGNSECGSTWYFIDISNFWYTNQIFTAYSDVREEKFNFTVILDR